MAKKKSPSGLKAPFLKKIWLDPEKVGDNMGYPLDIPVIRAEPFRIEFTHPVTIIVGPNGSGKSTIMEAIAAICGFGKLGGSKDYDLGEERNEYLSKFLKASWLPKVTQGFYTRAETISSFIQQIKEIAEASWDGPNIYRGYDGGLAEKSHGEGYTTIFRNKIRDKGIYVFDEPEAALSPARQIDFVKLIYEKAQTDYTQFIIATHSPFIMAYPGACILHLTPRGLVEKSYKETENFRILQEFYSDPSGFMRRVLEEEAND
jgi:predicted ATPase